MSARGFAFSSGREPVREGLVVVGEDLLDLEGGGLDELVQKGARGAGRLVLADLQVDPPCRPVDGDKQIAPGAFAGHLRQILDVHMHKARLVVLERLVGLVRSRLALLLAQHRFQVVYAVSPQAAVQRRAAQMGLRNSQATTSRSSRGNSSSSRTATTTASCASVRVVFNRCGRCEPSCT